MALRMPTSFETAAAQAASAQVSALQDAPIPVSSNPATSMGVRSFNLDLTSGAGLYTGGGTQLIFLRRGSHPGARVDVTLDGGTSIEGFRPGSRISTPFQGVTVKRSVACGGRIGADPTLYPVPARFLVTGEGSDFWEPAPQNETDGFTWPLAGNAYGVGGNASNGVLFAANEDVTNQAGPYWTGGTATDRWFNTLGFRKLRLFLYSGSSSGAALTDGGRLEFWMRHWAYGIVHLPLAALEFGGYSAPSGDDPYRNRVLDIDNPLYSHRGFPHNSSAPLLYGGNSGGGPELTVQLIAATGKDMRLSVDGVEG